MPPRADNDWRSPDERAELVERLIHAEADRNHLARTLRDWAEHVGSDRADVSYILLLQHRIAILEANQERLLAEKAA